MVAKMHRMHLPKIGEGVIHIPSGMPFEADATPLYPAGSYVRLGNKEFIYAIAGGTLNPEFGAMNSHHELIMSKGASEKILKGAMVVTLTILDTDALEEITVDELKGGEIACFPGEDNTFLRGITGNSALAAATTGVLSVYIDSPTPVEIPAEKWCDCIRNPYVDVKYAQGVWAMVMGMPTVVATDGQGLWLQVSGPSFAAPVIGAGGPGGAAKLQEIVFTWNGSIAVRETDDVALQHAGVVIGPGPSGEERSSPFIMLQIAH